MNIKIKEVFHTYPIHTFLLIPFLSLFLYANNTEFIAFFMLKRTLIWGAIFTIIIFIINYYILKKNKIKSGVFISILLILFFNYGVIYDYLETLYYKGLWPLKNIHRYLAFFYLILNTLLIYFFYKTKRKFISVNYALNLIIVGLFIWNGALLLYQLKNKNTISIINNKNLDIQSNNFISNHKILNDKPDIYFIVLDGYANHKVLKKYYNYDNSNFIDFLKKNNFQIIDSCRSNYYGTLLSLSSTLNIKYFNNKELENSQEIINQLRDNFIFRELKKNGYTIVQLKSGYSVTSFFNLTDSTINIEAPNEFERAILRYSMFRLDDVLGQIPFLRLKSQFEIFTNWKVNSLKPTFNFIHIVCPHPPYIFNAKGERFYKSNYTDNSWEPKESYIEQLVFVNNQVKKFLNNINSQYKKLNKEPIIILLSDHGPYLKSKNEDEVFEIRSKIFYAIKTSNSNLFPNFNTSVNTFPFVFNNFFDYNISYLPDSLAGEVIFRKSIHFKNLTN